MWGPQTTMTLHVTCPSAANYLPRSWLSKFLGGWTWRHVMIKRQNLFIGDPWKIWDWDDKQKFLLSGEGTPKDLVLTSMFYCRVFNRLEGLRLLWSLMKSRNNKASIGKWEWVTSWLLTLNEDCLYGFKLHYLVSWGSAVKDSVISDSTKRTLVVTG